MIPKDFSEVYRMLKEQVFILLGSIITFFSPLLWVFFLTGLLVTADLLVAFLVNRIKNNEPYKSKKHKSTIVKFLIYNCVIISGAILEWLFNVEGQLILKAIIVYIMVAELRSLDESYYKLKKKYIIREIVDYIQRKFINHNHNNKYEDETKDKH